MSDGDFSDAEEDSVRNAAAVIASRLHARAQHNALERRRRDNIKDMYGALKDAIPGMRSERVSRAAVLKKAVDLIVAKQGKLEDILAENRRLMQENDALERELQGIHNACIAVPALLDQNEANGDRKDDIIVIETPSVGEPSRLTFPPSALLNRKRRAPVDGQAVVVTNTC